MFGIGFQEMLIILVVVLIFFGPKRLPDLAKSLGKGIAEFKKASEEVRQGIQEAMKEETTSASEAAAKDAQASGATAAEAPAPEAKAEAPPDPYGTEKGPPPPASPAPDVQEPPGRPG